MAYNPLQIKAGQLRQRVSIQYAVLTQGAMNENTKDWTTRNQVWADISPITAREFVANEQIRGEVSHKITIRYDNVISNTDRIQDSNGKNYTITGILNIDTRNRKMEILCLQNV